MTKNDQMDDNGEILCAWDFAPYIPVRSDVIGEVVYAKRWQRAMIPQKAMDRCGAEVDGTKVSVDLYFVENESRHFPILDVLGRIPNAHDTRIASNMVCWLGTNAGRNFRRIAEHYTARGVERKNAYLFAWSEENIRCRMTNYGSVPKDHLALKFKAASQDVSRDLETLERVALWLGTDKGQDFIRACERNIRMKYEREHEARHRQRLSSRPSF